MRADLGRANELLDELRAYIANIIDQIDTFHTMYGKCDFEEPL